MIILKWYSIIFIIFSIFASIYLSGKDDDFLSELIAIILLMPIVLYLLLT